MKRTSVLSRVMFRRAAVRSLVPDLKLVLVVLTIGCESHVGVYRPAGLGEDTGLDPSALAGALDELARRSHILPDVATGEIFITAWYRDNSFATAARRGQARDDFAQIESGKLREAVLKAIEQNPGCGLNCADFSQSIKKQPLVSQGEGEGKGKVFAEAPHADACGTAGAATAAPAGKIYNRRTSGIITWLPADVEAAEVIERQYPQEEITAAIAALAGKEAVPGRVQRKIEQLQHERAAASRREQEEIALQQQALDQLDPVAQAKGEQLLSPHLRQLATKNHQQETTA